MENYDNYIERCRVEYLEKLYEENEGQNFEQLMWASGIPKEKLKHWFRKYKIGKRVFARRGSTLRWESDHESA